MRLAIYRMKYKADLYGFNVEADEAEIGSWRNEYFEVELGPNDKLLLKVVPKQRRASRFLPVPKVAGRVRAQFYRTGITRQPFSLRPVQFQFATAFEGIIVSMPSQDDLIDPPPLPQPAVPAPIARLSANAAPGVPGPTEVQKIGKALKALNDAIEQYGLTAIIDGDGLVEIEFKVRIGGRNGSPRTE